MRKYNTPEIKVSMFDVESIATADAASTNLANFNTFANGDGTVYEQYSWTEINDKLTVSF